ncbi:MAG: hypothetical protein Q4G16_07505, partial [Cruoricaptor ignavus]|nr:hypothetical protein [Cruoricaptor ignavus]
MKTKYLTSICIAASFYWNVNAQQIDSKYTPYMPADFPSGAPAWMLELTKNPENINYFEAQKMYKQYLLETPEARQKPSPLKAVNKYFQRWARAYEPYVKPDGSILLPTKDNFEKTLISANAEGKNPTAKFPLQNTQNSVNSTLSWKLLSPVITYDYQTKKVSPAQSNIQRFDVSRSNPNVLYCGTETGMVFRTTDKGENWTACTPNHYFGGEISSVEISYQNPDKAVVSAGNKVWLTNDGGDSWADISVKSHARYHKVRDVVINPENDNHFFLGDDAGFYESTDGGNSWREIAKGQCMDIKYNPKNPKILYVLQKRSSYLGFYKSVDGGKTFTDKGLPSNLRLVSARMGLHTTDSGQEYIYLLAGHGQFNQRPHYIGEPYLIKSSNGGDNWTSENISAKVESMDKYGGQGYYDMVMHVSPKNPEHILFGFTHFYKSDDGGKTLANLGGYYGKYDLHVDMQDIHTVGEDTWLSTDGGINYSNDFFENNAEAKINGIYASELWGFAQGWNEDIIAGGRNHNGNMVELDSYKGKTISLRGSEFPTGYIFMSNERKTAFSDLNENIIIPTDWKDAFVPFGRVWRFPMESTQYGMGFEFDPRYAKSFLSAQGSMGGDELKTLWKTTDDGTSFTQLYTFGREISAHRISRSNPDKIVVATSTEIHYSTDGGKTFTAYQNLPDALKRGLNFTVEIHPRDENEIWISSRTNGNMFRTKNNGETWEKLDNGLTMQNSDGVTTTYFVGRFFLTGNEKNAAYAIANTSKSFDPVLGSSIYTGKIIYRDDETNTWVDISQGLPPVMQINRMLPFFKEGKIRIATNNGVWERPLDEPDFRPVAQPMITDIGVGNPVLENQLQFESFSIVNQNNATWEWSFNPPVQNISDKNARNPIVTFNKKGYYDVTLKVTTPKGTDTKTVKNMIYWDGKVLSVNENEATTKDISLQPSSFKSGEVISLVHKNISGTTKVQVFD